jgi:hypothetical protein
VLQVADRRFGLVEPARGRGQRDLMWPGHVKAERLGPDDELAHVGVAAQQVVDELAAQRLLPPHHLPARVVVALRQACDGLIDHMKYRGRRRPHHLTVSGADNGRQLQPQAPRRGQIQLDRAPGGHPHLRCPAAEEPDGVELGRTGLATRGRGVRQQRQVVTEELDRDVPDVPAGAVRNLGQPRAVFAARPDSGAGPPRRAAVSHGWALCRRCDRDADVHVYATLHHLADAECCRSSAIYSALLGRIPACCRTRPPTRVAVVRRGTGACPPRAAM